MGIVKLWNLNWRQRAAITCFALCYLIFAKPWSQPNHSVAVDTYSCVAALVTLALVPQRARLWMAIGAALVVALLVMILIP